MVVTDFHPSRSDADHAYSTASTIRAHSTTAGWGHRFRLTNNRVMHPNVETMLRKAERKRFGVRPQHLTWVAIDEIPEEGDRSARGTEAFYASMEQYEKYFAAQLRTEVVRLCAVSRSDTVATSMLFPTKW